MRQAGSQGAREPEGSRQAASTVRRGRAEQHTWAPVATAAKRSMGTYLELVNECDRGARLSRADGSPHAHEPAAHHHDILDGASGGGGGGGGGSGGGGGKAAVCRSTTAQGSAESAGCGLGGGEGEAAECTGSTDLRA